MNKDSTFRLVLKKYLNIFVLLILYVSEYAKQLKVVNADGIFLTELEVIDCNCGLVLHMIILYKFRYIYPCSTHRRGWSFDFWCLPCSRFY